ncbi:unnamed protein product [Orchesella dallaii]|uniref:Uncharacterized protein n=1 Tax=Orchesella dallaii TaxID=48710 RepID=A0ABP1S235_9HEXA
MLKLERLIQTTDLNPTLNPFFSRSVTFYESFILNDDGTTYRILTSRGQCFTRILDRFGTQIWHATFNFTDNVVDDVDVAGVELALYNSVRIFLQGLPNLRSLSIIISGNQRVDPHNMTENFKQLLKTCPLPPLNHLIFLNMKNVPNPLQTGLLNHYSTHLKTLSFQNNLWRPSFPPDANIIMKESRLEELKAFIYCSPDLLSLQGSSLPLKCLHLRWIQPSDLDMIVGTLATFSNTLRHLKIEFRGAKMHNFEKFTGILNLPHLETIKISALHSHLSNIDFLSGCPALKELEVDMWEPCTKTTNPHVIQFNEHVGLMKHSNIWGILRSLEKIRIGTVTKVNDGGFSNNLGQIWKENRYEYLRP